MSLKGRLTKLEARGPSGPRCPECGSAPGDPVKHPAPSEAVGTWAGYPEPLLCRGCGRVLRFTFSPPGILE